MDGKLTTQIDFYHIFDIDADAEKANQLILSNPADVDILAFVNKMANESRHGDSRRQAQLIQSSGIRTLLSNNYVGNESAANSKIADLLLSCEKEYNSARGAFNKIRKGSLLISKFTQDGSGFILIAKIDVENFFEAKNFKLVSGLPQEKGIFKTCLIECNGNSIFDDIYLSDKNPTISKFWWDNFVQCKFVRDSIENTTQAFNRIHSSLTSINKISEVDFSILKGNLNSYFTTAKNFNVKEMIDRVVGSYAPESKDVKTDIIKKDLERICASGKFDTSFEIDITPVKSKIRRIIKIDDDIELKIKSGDVNKIFHLNHKGNNYIAVKALSGYGNFKRLDVDES